jgi:hypothetical protein
VIETTTHTALRDRALLGVLAYTFARIGAVVNLRVEDYYPSGKRFFGAPPAYVTAEGSAAGLPCSEEACAGQS